MMLFLSVALALPMYAQRSGRTCGNCHVSPTLEDEEGWDNPKLLKRKCTMTCVSCHVDPTGGGLRNTSGRYFGASSIAVLPTQDRSYSDHDRELVSPGVIWKWLQQRKPPPKGEDRTIPSDLHEAQQGVGDGQTGNVLVTGDLKRPATMSFWDGRYGSMNADPVFQLGVDARFAFYSGTKKFFPMQLDLHAALHPTHHLMVVATASAQPTGPSRDAGSFVFMRRAFVMVNELPGMGWVKAGAFQPGFGTFLDDHTSPSRTLFEVSAAESINTVVGGEIGIAPNYPFAQVSVFMNDVSFLGASPDTGWGAAAQGGWRDLSWSLTGHAQLRRRQGRGRGDLLAGGIGWSVSPSWSWNALPVTWLGELNVGRRERVGRVTLPTTGMSELSFLIRNGIVLKVRSDVWMEQFDLADLQHREALGLSIAPVPGLTLETTGRLLWGPNGKPAPDVLVQTHLWL